MKSERKVRKADKSTSQARRMKTAGRWNEKKRPEKQRNEVTAVTSERTIRERHDERN